jgi:hypothetical protein
VSQFEKAALVAKLKAARERRKDTTGKCGGRPSLAESSPQTVALARKLRRYPLNGRKRSLREVAVELEAAGHVTSAGTRYGAAAVARLIRKGLSGHLRCDTCLAHARARREVRSVTATIGGSS